MFLSHLRGRCWQLLCILPFLQLQLSNLRCTMKYVKQFFFGFCGFIFSECKVMYLLTSLGLKVHYFTSAYYRSCWLVFASSFFEDFGSPTRPFSTIFLEFLFIDGANGIPFIIFCLSIWIFSRYFLNSLSLTFFELELLEIHSIVVSQAYVHEKYC